MIISKEAEVEAEEEAKEDIEMIEVMDPAEEVVEIEEKDLAEEAVDIEMTEVSREVVKSQLKMETLRMSSLLPSKTKQLNESATMSFRCFK